MSLRIPTLWSSIYIRRVSDLDRASTYLSRCSPGPLPLDILIDTVGVADHYPGITLFRDELQAAFDIIDPYVHRWRSFFLKLRDNECKAITRNRLSAIGPACALETLQLYHFEQWTSQNLYLATLQPPMVLFEGVVPKLKNLSLIGVNLSWGQTPFLLGIRNLELALHVQPLRPTYSEWGSFLRNSPNLERLSLHYSGPRLDTGVSMQDVGSTWPPNRDIIELENLKDLNLVDLDPDYLCLIFEHLSMPNLKKLGLDLPEQDFSIFVDLVSGARRRSVTPRNVKNPRKIDINAGPPGRPRGYFESVERLAITSLECSADAWRMFLPSIRALQVMEVDFRRMGTGFYDALFDLVDERVPSIDAPTSSVVTTTSTLNDCTLIDCDTSSSSSPPLRKARVRLLPKLDTIQLSGLPGTRVKELIAFSQRLGCTVKRWIVKWDENRRGRDVVLDRLIEKGWRESWNNAGLTPESELEAEADEKGEEEEDDDNKDESDIRIDAYRGSEDEETDDEEYDDELTESRRG